MKSSALVALALLFISVQAQDELSTSLSRLRGRSRGARILSRERLADVIEDAVAIEDSGESGRKRVLVRKPNGAFRRIKLVRRPRPTVTTITTEAPTQDTSVFDVGSTRVFDTTTTERPATSFTPHRSTLTRTSPAPPITPVPVVEHAREDGSEGRFSHINSAQSAFKKASFQSRPPTPASFDEQFRQGRFESNTPQTFRSGPPTRRPTLFSPASVAPRRQPTEFVRPQTVAAPQDINRQEEIVGTVKDYSYYNEDGSFTFGYEAEDGSFKEETRGADCVVRGKYGYIDPDGVKREFTYESGNPCTGEEEDEGVEFDEQGFPILEEDGSLGGQDLLDDQPILINHNQFIAQTKEEQLSENELSQFRRPKAFRNRAPLNEIEKPARFSATRAPTDFKIRNAQRRPVSEETEPPVRFVQENRAPFTVRPFFNQPKTPLPRRPLTQENREPFPAKPFVDTSRRPVTLRPNTRPPVTFARFGQPTTLTTPQPSRFSENVSPSIRPQREQEHEKEKQFNQNQNPPFIRPFVSFGPNIRPTAFPSKHSPPSGFNFDNELNNLKSRPKVNAPSLDGNDEFIVPSAAHADNQRPRPPQETLNHELTFNPQSGEHRTQLLQKLPGGTEIHIGENLKSFSDSTTPPSIPPSFSNSFFQSSNNRFNTPENSIGSFNRPQSKFITNIRPSTTSAPAFTSFNPSVTPTPFVPRSPEPTPQTPRPTVFSVFNRPTTQSEFRAPPSAHREQTRPVFEFEKPSFPPPRQRQPFTVFNKPTEVGNERRAPNIVGQRTQPRSPVPRNPSNRPPSNRPRPVQQISFGTQVANPVFNRFGVPQPFQPNFGRSPPLQPGDFRPPQPINFFSN